MIRHFLRGSAGYFLACIVFSACTSILDLINPKIVGITVDSVIGTKEAGRIGIGILKIDAENFCSYARTRLWLPALLIIAVAAAAALTRFLTRLCNGTGSERLVKTMRDDLFGHILHLPFTWFDHQDTGDIIQRCTSDTETIKRFLSEQLTGLFRTLILIFMALTFMWEIQPKLTLCAAAFIPVIVGYSLFFHGKIHSSFERADKEEGRLSTLAQENLTGVRVVRAFGRELYEKERFACQNNKYTQAFMDFMKLLAWFWAAGDFISGLQVLTVVVFGAVMTVHHQMTAGGFISFVSYNAMLVWPVRSLGRVISDMSKTGVSIDRVRFIMNSPPEKDAEDACDLPEDHTISFEDVTFSYSQDGPLVLDHVSLTIPEGSVCGILGGTGSGKTTIMRLLKRMYDLPEGQGTIRIGGTDIRKIRSDSLRAEIGMVLQEPYLFSRTIQENIAITEQETDLARVRQAADIAMLDDTVMRFERGYDTFVGERGVTLSGGQKQRTAIARIMMQKPPVMIFDDSFSAIDAQTDAAIRENLKEAAKGSTTILISHRIATLMHADQILVMQGGRIIQRGTHEELIAQEGIYRRICRIQSILPSEEEQQEGGMTDGDAE